MVLGGVLLAGATAVIISFICWFRHLSGSSGKSTGSIIYQMFAGELKEVTDDEAIVSPVLK